MTDAFQLMNKNMVNKTFSGKKSATVFKDYERRAFIIGISDYSILRTEEGKEAFKDLPETLTDVMIVNAGLKYLGFQESEITTIL